MSYLCNRCLQLKELDLSRWDTSKATDMSGMFAGCGKLDSVSFCRWWNTEKVEKMAEMFKDCKKLKEIYLTGFDTGSVTDMKRMFSGCRSLEALGMRAASTALSPETQDIFRGCESLTSVEFPSNPLQARSIKTAAAAVIKANTEKRAHVR